MIMGNIQNSNGRDLLVSVVVPVYNVEPYVGRCIRSICEQTYHNLEIILVDDGSTDGSGKICDAYAEQDTRITVFHQKNGGLSAARNKGIDAAKGAYIAFVDSDDFISSTFIDVLVTLAEKTGSDIVQVSVKAFLEKNGFTGEGMECDPASLTPEMLTGRDMCAAMFNNAYEGCGVVWNKIYRAHLFKDRRFPLGKFHEDDFLVYQLFWHAGKVAVSDVQQYFYQSHRPGSIMHQKYSVKRLDGLEARREQFTFFAAQGDRELSEMAKVSYVRDTAHQIGLLKTSDIANKAELIKRIRKAAIPVLKECLLGRSISVRSKVGMVVKLCRSVL